MVNSELIHVLHNKEEEEEPLATIVALRTTMLKELIRMNKELMTLIKELMEAVTLAATVAVAMVAAAAVVVAAAVEVDPNSTSTKKLDE